MQEEKSYVYTIILGVCMLLCLAMIGRMLLGHPEQAVPPETGSSTLPEQEETAMELREAELCDMIGQALPVPVHEMTTQIGADKTISVVILVSKQDLQESGLVPGGLRTALMFLPDECRMYGTWTASVTNGKILLKCEKAEIGEIEIPADLVSMLTDQVAASVNEYFAQAGVTPEKLEWTDGALRLTA